MGRSVLLCSIQDISVLFNVIIVFLMFFNTFVFQAGLVSLLFRKFKGTIILTAAYFALSISLHVWLMVSSGSSPSSPEPTAPPGAQAWWTPLRDMSKRSVWSGSGAHSTFSQPPVCS